MKLFDHTAAPGWFDWVTLVLAVAAFIFAILQLRGTREANKKSTDALEKSTTALNRARIQLNWDLLSAVLPQLKSVSSDLDFAMQNNNAPVSHRALVRYSGVATEAIALVRSLKVENHLALISKLDESANTALDIKAVIVSKPAPNVPILVKKIANMIEVISKDISGIVANYRNQLGEHDHV